ncbi:platelet-activating factor receptor-like [Pristis pectinata]|uniref:platelet-activating factor receptor-like n=1 Tax=Pristis pectinata TaxID=685728 RepID=UPI00223E647D|nr:platelet-activating factor receptor-like [Pristis pectinata]
MNCTKDKYYETSPFKCKFFGVIYSLLFIIGLPENIATCCYLLYNKGNKRLTEVKIYMISLTLADLMFILFLPFWVDYYHRESDWKFGDFMCGFCGSLFYINTYSTLCFLSLISFTRYLAVSRPVETAQSKQVVRGVILTAIIWTGTVGASIWVLADSKKHTNEKHNATSCFEDYWSTTGKNGKDNETQKINLLVIHSIMLLVFALTLGAVIANYVLILRKLSADQSALRLSQDKLKKRAIRMVLMVLVIYILCFLPYHLIQLPWMLLVLDIWKPFKCNFRKTFNDVHQVTLGLMSINCVLDPIVYCFLTEDFRQYLRELINYHRNNCILRNKPKP